MIEANTDNPKCECCGIRLANADYNRGGEDVRGAPFAFQCWGECFRANGNVVSKTEVAFCAKIRARRAAQPKFYGTQPDKLPQTLPAGVRSVSIYGIEYYANHVVRLATNGYIRYEGAWSDEVIGVLADQIDWSTVPIQEEASATCGSEYFVGVGPIPTQVCCRPSGHCGYCESGEGLNTYRWWQAEIVPSAPSPQSHSTHIIAPNRVVCSCSTTSRLVLATHGEYCVYCSERMTPFSESTRYARSKFGSRDIAARARMDLADIKAKPPETATSRELAKGHPSTWPSQDGEP